MSLLLLTFMTSKIWLNVSIMAKFSSKSVFVRGETISNDLLGDEVISMMTFLTVVNLLWWNWLDPRRFWFWWSFIKKENVGKLLNIPIFMPQYCQAILIFQAAKEATLSSFIKIMSVHFMYYVNSIKMIKFRVRSVDTRVVVFYVFRVSIDRYLQWR